MSIILTFECEKYQESTSLMVYENMKFSEVTSMFFKKIGPRLNPKYDVIMFVYNHKWIYYNSNETLTELNIKNNSRISVLINPFDVGSAPLSVKNILENDINKD